MRLLVPTGVLATLLAVTGSPLAYAQNAVLGTKNPAKGSPVTIGLITEGGSEAIGAQSDLTEQGAKIAVEYINTYRNGLNGHKIELLVCGNQSTPAGGQECANRMVEKRVAAVVLPYTGQGAAQVPIITGAGIPYVTMSGASSQELTTPGSFALTGGFPAVLGAMAAHAKRQGYGKVINLVVDVPAATQGARLLGEIAFKNAGVAYDVISVAPGTPDMTPQLQAAIDQDADAVGIVGDVVLCTAFLKAYQTLALRMPKYVIGTCTDKTIVDSLGATLAGSYIGTFTAPSERDRKLYAAMVKKYGKNVDPNPTKSSGVAAGVVSFMTFRNAMEGLSTDPTAATVLAQMQVATDVPIFLGGGATATCDGTAIPILKSVCSADTAVGVVTKNGQIKDLELFDAAALYQT